jgi:hypothetical protein
VRPLPRLARLPRTPTRIAQSSSSRCRRSCRRCGIASPRGQGTCSTAPPSGRVRPAAAAAALAPLILVSAVRTLQKWDVQVGYIGDPLMHSVIRSLEAAPDEADGTPLGLSPALVVAEPRDKKSVYEEACRLAAVPPAEALYVGAAVLSRSLLQTATVADVSHRPSDVPAAKACGMHVLWKCTPHVAVEEDDPLHASQIKTLREVARYVSPPKVRPRLMQAEGESFIGSLREFLERRDRKNDVPV